MKGNQAFRRTPAFPFKLVPGKLPECSIAEGTDLDAAATECVESLSDLALDRLTEDALWRDQLAFTGDLRTFCGRQAVLHTWRELSRSHRPAHFCLVPGSSRVVRLGPTTSWIQARFEFSCYVDSQLPANASGLIGIVRDEEQQSWKIWMLATILEEVEGWGNPDVLSPAQSKGHALNDRGGHVNGFAEDCESTTRGIQGSSTYYDAVVVGGGFAGLSVSGRLKALGVSAIVVDRHAKAGDNWLTRYESVKLHTSKGYGHLPFSRTFGSDYPYFLAAKDMARGYQWWVKEYAIEIMHCSIVQKAEWDDAYQKWTISVRRGSERIELTSKHMVFATGAGGSIPKMPELQNREQFKGIAMHSVSYKTSRDWAGKKGVVIGTANTAHDVADDMVLAGASTVTMVQRSVTPVFPIEYYRQIFDPLYNDQTDFDVADRETMGIPNAIVRQLAHEGIKMMASQEPERFDALERVGFRTDRFPDLYQLLLERLGGHYQDVGVSQKISHGLIKVKSDAKLEGYYDEGLFFDDGSQLQADVVVFCTGFEGNMRYEVSKIVGEAVGDQLEDYWALDSEGEIRGAFKYTGHPGIWYTGGTIGFARYYSRFIALQIKAAVIGRPFERYIEDASIECKN